MVRTFHDAIRRGLFNEGGFSPVESSRLCPLAIIRSMSEAPSSPKILKVEFLTVRVSVTKFFLQDGVVNPKPNPQPGGPGDSNFGNHNLNRHLVASYDTLASRQPYSSRSRGLHGRLHVLL